MQIPIISIPSYWILWLPNLALCLPHLEVQNLQGEVKNLYF